MRVELIAASILLALMVAAAAEPIAVARTIDGDTLELTSGERIRVLNVDTPELHGARCNREFALAMRAKERLAELFATGRPISISRQGRDRYRRALAVVTYPAALAITAAVCFGLPILIIRLFS